MSNIVAELRLRARERWAVLYEHDGWITDAANRIEELERAVPGTYRSREERQAAVEYLRAYIADHRREGYDISWWDGFEAASRVLEAAPASEVPVANSSEPYAEENARGALEYVKDLLYPYVLREAGPKDQVPVERVAALVVEALERDNGLREALRDIVGRLIPLPITPGTPLSEADCNGIEEALEIFNRLPPNPRPLSGTSETKRALPPPSGLEAL